EALWSWQEPRRTRPGRAPVSCPMARCALFPAGRATEGGIGGESREGRLRTHLCEGTSGGLRRRPFQGLSAEALLGKLRARVLRHPQSRLAQRPGSGLPVAANGGPTRAAVIALGRIGSHFHQAIEGLLRLLALAVREQGEPVLVERGNVVGLEVHRGLVVEKR